jgi:cbb3-type cytochrome oxidase cytochrome c subunit
MEDPRATTPQSIMPAYPWLLEDDLDFAVIQSRVDAMVMLGGPYGEAVNHAPALAELQARRIGREILEQGGQSPDHPVHPAIPETRYLKAFFCRVTGE